jgi:hypothetical protein
MTDGTWNQTRTVTRHLDKAEAAIDAGDTRQLVRSLRRASKALARIEDADAAAPLRNRHAALVMASVTAA